MRSVFALLAVTLFSLTASATVVTSGQITVPVTIPTSLALNAYESSSEFWLIPEITGMVLPQDLPGGAGGLPTIPAGTRVDVYLVHADPVQPVILSGTATFDGLIVGFYPGLASLNASDPYAQANGSPILTYPMNVPNRGLELGCEICFDRFSLSDGNHTIALTLLFGGNNMDEARILVATPAAEPGSLALLLAPAAIFAVIRVRRRNPAARIRETIDTKST